MLVKSVSIVLTYNLNNKYDNYNKSDYLRLFYYLYSHVRGLFCHSVALKFTHNTFLKYPYQLLYCCQQHNFTGDCHMFHGESTTNLSGVVYQVMCATGEVVMQLLHHNIMEAQNYI